MGKISIQAGKKDIPLLCQPTKIIMSNYKLEVYLKIHATVVRE